MSRGHGVRQRQLLERVDGMTGDRGRFVSPPGATPSDSAALRRAAYQLEREGLLQLRIHRGRLAMFRPDVEPAVPEGFVTGVDGRFYRSPFGQTREDIEDDKEQARLHREFSARYGPIAEEHGHPHGPGNLMCYECAVAADADSHLLEVLRAHGLADAR